MRIAIIFYLSAFITIVFSNCICKFDQHRQFQTCYSKQVSQPIDNSNKITNQDAEFIFKLAKKLAIPKEYILLEKMINQVELESYLLLDINTVLFEAIENSKLSHNNKQQLQDLRIKRFTYFSYQRAISYIPSVENGFALHRQILADEFLDDILRAKLMVQFKETIIPICLNIEPEQSNQPKQPDQPKQQEPKQPEPQYPEEYRRLNNVIDTIIFEN
ncbi:hypothetical protein F8M41_020178 [Gigaspora margarita]|uniref:Uncharacterized protein n=1 Tax=Gigaspora margarita TaxID=4874 RepID=A0A8H4AIY8_GIGMA|nr:hypothetical protein F8M41_020178 [Gigaspora margarita]